MRIEKNKMLLNIELEPFERLEISYKNKSIFVQAKKEDIYMEQVSLKK